MSGTTVIRDAMVLPGPGAAVLPRADIVVTDGGITAVGVAGPVVLARADRVVDGTGRLAVPGLVNAHMHSQSGTMAGFGDRLSHPAFMWLTQAHTARRTPEESRLAVLLSAAQMLLSGTTACIDHFPGQRFSLADMDAVMAAWEETGMRVLLGMRFFDGSFGDILPEGIDWPPGLAEQVRGTTLLHPHPLPVLREEMPEVVARWQGRDGRLAVCPAPSNPDRCSDEALLFCADLAERHDLAIHTHLLETQAQARIAERRYGTTTVAHLEDLGILSDRWSCAHCCWLTPDDIGLMARRQAVAVHNPESNARIGTGRMDTPALLAAGVPVAVGTDGPGANDNLILQEAMRAAALLHRADLPDRRRWVSAEDAFAMGTVGGARALRRPDLGRIAPGMLADIVLYDLTRPWWRPVNDAIAQFVFAETGAAVDWVMVQGRVLVEGGRITAFDAEAALAEVPGMVAAHRQRNADLFAVAELIAGALP